MKQRFNTRKITVIAMLSAIAYVVMVVGRVPVVLFLKYDPKDVVITIGGFLFGPLAALSMAVAVSFVEMFTVSETGFIGLVMNVISTCSFACTAAIIYKRKREIKGAIIGLVAGWIFATVVMLLWNYLITPLYMTEPGQAIADVREAVAKLLLPAFLPFNLIKGGLNAAIAMLLYKPLSNALRKSRLLPAAEVSKSGSRKVIFGYILISAFVIITCTLLILVLQGYI